MRSRAFLLLPLILLAAMLLFGLAGRTAVVLIPLPLLGFGHAWGLQAVKTGLGW